MSEFPSFEVMSKNGVSPAEIARRAEEQGLDEIQRIRLLRTTCGLTLREAKEILFPTDVWSLPQRIEIGSKVCWDGWNTIEGFYAEQGTVIAIEGDQARVRIDQKILLRGETLEEVLPQATPSEILIPLAYFEKPLVERFEASLDFVKQLADAFSKTA